MQNQKKEDSTVELIIKIIADQLNWSTNLCSCNDAELSGSTGDDVSLCFND